MASSRRGSWSVTVVNGVVAATKKLDLKIPLVVRLEGTNVELGKKILAESGLKITPADGIGGAAAAIKQVLGGAK